MSKGWKKGTIWIACGPSKRQVEWVEAEAWIKGPLAITHPRLHGEPNTERFNITHIKTGLGCCSFLKKVTHAKKIADTIMEEFGELLNEDNPSKTHDGRKLRACGKRIAELKRLIDP
jgi:hypothetical protein